MIGFRAPPELRRAINDWRRDQADLPTLSEAIRRLVEQALGEAQRKKRIKRTVCRSSNPARSAT
jgi:hypothetical protein